MDGVFNKWNYWKRANLQKVVPKEELTEIILAAGESNAKMTN